MVQKTRTDATSTNISPPTKKAKLQRKEASPSEDRSSHPAPIAENLNHNKQPTNSGTEENQQSTNIATAENKQQSKNGIFNFILPSEEDTVQASEENLEPSSDSLMNTRTGRAWNKSLEEAHSAKIKERSLLGHIICSEGTQKKILESDIFRILKSEGVTEIGALYKVSPSKFVLVFGSKTAREKLADTVIQCRFDDADICLNFHKRVGPFRNGREPIFVTILLPELVSDQAVRLAFSKFGEVISVFKGRHKFNKNIRNGKRHVKIFPAGEDPATLPRKITFHGSVKRDVLFAERVVRCYRCKTRHMLGENCPVATPSMEDSDMSLTEQSDNVDGGAVTAQPEPSVETQLPTESLRKPSPIQEEDVEGDSSMESESGSDSDSGSDSSEEDEPVLESLSGPAAPAVESPASPSRENLSNDKGARVDQQRGSQSPKTAKPPVGEKPIEQPTQTSSSSTMRPLKSLRHFNEQEIFPKWYRNRETSVLREALQILGIKDNFEGYVEVVHAAADLIYAAQINENHYNYRLQQQYDRYCKDNPNGPRLTIEKFDDYLFRWAKKVWPCALDIVFRRIASSPKP